jgi:DNA-binding NarL/FixJ family response regulator
MQPHLRLAPTPPEFERSHGAEARIRIVLADDHQSMRRNLRLLLDAEKDIDVVAEATDLSSTTRSVHQRRPDVLIIDVRLLSAAAPSAVGVLRDGAPDTQIVVMTMEASRSVATRVVDAGVLGYVLKEQSDRDLLPAVRAAARRKSYVSREITPLLKRR